MRSLANGLALLLLAACASTAALEAELGAAPAVKGGPWDRYVQLRGRRVEGEPPWEWVIGTSVRTLLHRSSGSRLLLFSMHHLSSPAYFHAVGQRLRSADLVLAEGIDAEGKSLEEAPEDLRDFHNFQIEICHRLGLQKQSEWESGIRDARWFAADVTMEETERILKLTRTTLSPRDLAAKRERLQAADGVLQGQAFLLRSIASLSADEATHLDGLQALRDARAFAALKQRRQPGRRVAVVYGALHTRKLEPRLVAELGYEVESEEWLEVAAFRFDPRDAEGLELRGWLRQREGDLEGAFADYERCLALDPNAVIALRGRAQIRLERRDADGARADFQRAVDLEPRHTRSLLGVAQSLMRLHRDREAVAFLTRALEIDPEFWPALIQRGIARGDSGDVPGALEDLNRGLEHLPGDPEALYARAVLRYKQGDDDQALRDLTAALQKLQKQPLPHLLRGRLHVKAGRLKEAVEDFSEVLDVEPDHVEARYARAYLRVQLKEVEKALTDLNRVLELAPELRSGRHARAMIHLERRNYAAAVADCDLLLATEPSDTAARQMRAKARWSMGEHLQALADYEALASPPGENSPDALIWIAKMRRVYGGDPKDLERAMKRAVEARPSDPALRMLRGDLAYDEGLWDEAETAYRDLAARPGLLQGRALLRMWMLAARRGAAAEAEPALRDWLRGDPADQVGAWIGGLFLGERDEKSVLQLLPGCDGAFHAGSRRLFAGDPEGARALFAKADGHPPCGSAGHPAAAAALQRLGR